jgi:hypothetical protein
MPHTYKSFGQNMQCKTPHKLLMAQSHDFCFGIVFIVFVGKCNRGIIDGFDTIITDGYLMGVTT